MSSSAEAGHPLVRLRRLEKRFKAKRAIGPIDLDLDGCQIVGVVGPDGAGKTTLLRSLAGLLEVTADEATVLGHDLRADPTELKRAIGYVPQAFSLQRDLSVRENLWFTAKLHRIEPAEFERRAGALLRRTGLTPFADRLAGALSGGMKQKLAISNALLIAPKLVILDEPTAGVDVAARSEIWSLLEAERRRALVLISSSYLDEAEGCDRLIYLDDGRIVASGSPEELRRRVGRELFRVWGDDPRAMARAARDLPYVGGARACAGHVRVEVESGSDDSRVLAGLRCLPGARFAERAAVDMESTLLALAREAERGTPA